MENCPGCVTAATEARFFCRQCGTPVQAQAPTTSAPAPQHAPPPPATAPTLAFAPVFPVAPAAPVDAPAPVAAPPQLAAPTLAAPEFTPPTLTAPQFTPASAATPPASARKRLWAAGGVAGVVAAALVAGYLLGNGGTTGSVRTPDTDARADVASPSAAPEASTLQDRADTDTGDDTSASDGTDEEVLLADSTFDPGYVFFPPSASSDCVLPKRKDTTGQYFTYEPENATDKLDDTAWRCGHRTGRLSLDLGGPTRLTNVGLVPGYTKTDPDGTNWFYENLTVTKAKWTFYLHGQVVAQYTEVIDEPEEAMEWITLPSAVTADSASLDVVETGNPDARFPYIAISGIGLADDNNV
jgi:hypothetical protein